MTTPEFRREILQAHYDITGGNLSAVAMRPEVAKRLGFADFNDSKLFGQIEYLEAMGYLQSADVVNDMVTLRGINEVEKGFPTLSSEPNLPPNVARAIDAVQKIDEAKGIGAAGLLKTAECTEVELNARNTIEAVIDPDSVLGRKYQKQVETTIWSSVPTGSFAPPDWIAHLDIWRGFLTDYLDEQDIPPTDKQTYVKSGGHFAGRKAIRHIIGGADREIDVQDGYLSEEIFALIEPAVVEHPALKVRLLTRPDVPRAVKSDKTAFCAEFPTASVEIRSTTTTHDRLIIIDHALAYHIGHSLKGLGDKASVITKLDDTAKAAAITDFDTTWAAATVVS